MCFVVVSSSRSANTESVHDDDWYQLNHVGRHLGPLVT